MVEPTSSRAARRNIHDNTDRIADRGGSPLDTAPDALELKGLSKSRGPTAYSTLKMMGYKGTREKVLSDLNAWRDKLLNQGESK
jgi:hypothetical protein